MLLRCLHPYSKTYTKSNLFTNALNGMIWFKQLLCPPKKYWNHRIVNSLGTGHSFPWEPLDREDHTEENMLGWGRGTAKPWNYTRQADVYHCHHPKFASGQRELKSLRNSFKNFKWLHKIIRIICAPTLAEYQYNQLNKCATNSW